MSTHTNAQTTGGISPRTPHHQEGALLGRAKWVDKMTAQAVFGTPRPIPMQEAVDAHNAMQAAAPNPNFEYAGIRLAPRRDDWTPNVGPEATSAAAMRYPSAIQTTPFPMQQMPHQGAAVALGSLAKAADIFRRCDEEANAAHDEVEIASRALEDADQRLKKAKFELEIARADLLAHARKKAA